MRISIEINNKSGEKIKRSFFEDVAKGALELSGLEFLKNKNIAISFALIASKEIKTINKTYRKKDAVTDVLSFSEYKNSESLKKYPAKNIFLGEIILCYNYIKQYAREEKKETEEELINVISHGVLHLLGFRHSKEMFDIQKKVIRGYYKSI